MSNLVKAVELVLHRAEGDGLAKEIADFIASHKTETAAAAAPLLGAGAGAIVAGKGKRVSGAVKGGTAGLGIGAAAILAKKLMGGYDAEVPEATSNPADKKPDGVVPDSYEEAGTAAVNADIEDAAKKSTGTEHDRTGDSDYGAPRYTPPSKASDPAGAYKFVHSLDRPAGNEGTEPKTTKQLQEQSEPGAFPVDPDQFEAMNKRVSTPGMADEQPSEAKKEEPDYEKKMKAEAANPGTRTSKADKPYSESDAATARQQEAFDVWMRSLTPKQLKELKNVQAMLSDSREAAGLPGNGAKGTPPYKLKKLLGLAPKIEMKHFRTGKPAEASEGGH